MAVETAEERLAFLEDFGFLADWSPGGGPAVQVRAIFDADYVAVDGGAEQELSSAGPACLVRTEDVPGVVIGDFISPNAPNAAAIYQIADFRPDAADGEFTRLFLHKSI